MIVDDLAPAQAPPVRVRRTRVVAKAVRILSWATLAVVAGATGILWIVSEHTWWGTLFTFLPRHAFLAAPAVLLVCSAFIDWRSAIINLASVGLAAGPLMGGKVPLALMFRGGTHESSIRIVSCNVQYFQPGVESVLQEIRDLSPDVVALQEAFEENPLLPRYFPGWHILHEDQYWIGSRFPLHRVNLCNTGVFPHPTVFTVRIDGPQGPFIVNDVHLTTPRYGLLKINGRSVLDGSGPRDLESYTLRRLAEARQSRDYVDSVQAKSDDGRPLPTVIVGDFNTPTVSSLYRAAWPGFTNAFDSAGFGFGYTAPCTEHKHWFNDVPWVRIDHILADARWSVAGCRIGHSKGSDHRLISAELSPLK